MDIDLYDYLSIMFDTLHKVVKEIPDILNLDLSYLINPTYLIIAIFPALIATWITIVLYKVYKKIFKKTPYSC